MSMFYLFCVIEVCEKVYEEVVWVGIDCELIFNFVDMFYENVCVYLVLGLIFDG